MFKSLALSLAAAATVYASPLDSLSKASNGEACVPCQPQGATGIVPPAVGAGLISLYIDLLASVKGIDFQKRAMETRTSGFCCRQTLNCVNVQRLNIPMCYDKFTTNFAFADGSYGSLTTGEYSSGASSANLISGNYTNGSDQGNIYANDPQAKPNMATLSVPPQYTGTGVGGAIPVTELGSIVVYTTTIPGTTYTAPTTLAQTVKLATVSGQAVPTTIPATTISEATTIAPLTSVVTQTKNAVAASSTGAAGRVTIGSERSAEISILGAMMYAVFAL